MQVRKGRLVSLGHGRWVRSDEVVAVEPIRERRGPGRRALVWVRGLPEALVSSRSEDAVLRDLTGESHDDMVRQQETARALERLTSAVEAIPPLSLNLLGVELGRDLGALTREARRVLGGTPAADGAVRRKSRSKTAAGTQ